MEHEELDAGFASPSPRPQPHPITDLAQDAVDSASPTTVVRPGTGHVSFVETASTVLPAVEPAPAYDSLGRSDPPRPRARLTTGSAALVVALSLLAGGAGGYLGSHLGSDRGRIVVSLPAATAGPAPAPAPTSFAGIAARVLPSVVLINVRSASEESSGSGFVLTADGYLLTNNHVVARAGSDGRIDVVFADGSHERATIVGGTADYDLAVIKVDRAGLTPLALGDSDAVRVGDPVMAVGAPLGLDGTVTTGIVSALNRPLAADDGSDASQTAFINAIQTDAAINPGNSGGPLVNAAGEVIGISSVIATQPGLGGSAAGNIGLGFAIPSNQAKRTAAQLIATGTATYPVVGAYLDTRYEGEGVQVSTADVGGEPSVRPGGPADRAGIKAGDIVLAIDGRPVTDPDELIVAIRAKSPGDSVLLKVRSKGAVREVRLVLDEASSG